MARKLRVSCWAAATGTTIRAETSSSPTVRIATVMVTAASTAMRMLYACTGTPLTRACSSSWHTANSWGESPMASAMTRTPSPPTSHRSPSETVVIEPNR